MKVNILDFGFLLIFVIFTFIDFRKWKKVLRYGESYTLFVLFATYLFEILLSTTYVNGSFLHTFIESEN